MAGFDGKNLKWKLMWVAVCLCALSLAFASGLARIPGDTDNAARKLERTVGRRLALMDSYAAAALSEPADRWLDLKGLPDDIVVYRYVSDSLQSWGNTFPIGNDDISDKFVMTVFANPRNEISSGLLAADTVASYVNLGSRWYLLKSYQKEHVKVIAGLEIQNMLSESTYKGVNPRFKLDDKYSIRQIAFSGGTAVNLDGRPQFKVLYDSLQSYLMLDFTSLLFALLFFYVALLLYLSNHRSLKNCFWCILLSFLVSACIYVWGRFTQDNIRIFSPGLYADGPFFYSLGAVLLINLQIAVSVSSVYMVRKQLLEYMEEDDKGLRCSAVSVSCLAVIVSILFFIGWSFRSIALNSGICLELYRLDQISVFTALVYVSFIMVLMTIPHLLQMLRPGIRMWAGIKFKPLSHTGRLVFSVLAAVYLVSISSVLGFQKERNRVEVWANRLSVDRDISLELYLRSVEHAIASDIILASLSMLDNSATLISNRLSESYLYRISQNYDISVFLLNASNLNPRSIEYFNSRVLPGNLISPNSYFKYNETGTGHTRYTGLFFYQNPKYGTTRMLVEVEPKANREDRGYAKLLGSTAPGKVAVSSKYSYARYANGNLLAYKGTYPYPTKLNDAMASLFGDTPKGHLIYNGFRHFVTEVSDSEMVVISRPEVGAFRFLLAVVFLGLMCYVAISAPLVGRRVHSGRRNYYRNRVITVLVVSLVVTLFLMAVVSVLFVYGRNDANRRTLMSEKTGSVQSVVEKYCHNAQSYLDLNNPDFFAALEEASKMIRADITLYTPEGLEFHTTMPEVFEARLMGRRMDSKAFGSISEGNKRYHIQRETQGKVTLRTLYAPILNDNGKMIAILGSPYTEDNYDFEMEAVMHLATIFTVFLILLILVRFIITSIVSRMFKPLSEMNKQMNANSVGSLEFIDYGGDDEISSIVSSYNRMVTDLSESTTKLAQAERDKAWSAMARQVAHEIKNPLTPMKLQVQRVMRLKDKKAPNWEERFDEASKIILDHIDVLSQTANDFSTFAKLYSEEPIEINLDEMLKEEVAMFDNHDNIELSYFGFSDARAVGPKPQLTRVFVNLISNAVQAVESARQDDLDKGLEPRGGQVRISLRNSSVRDGYYDIVFEDNGHGVSEENMEKLFTPNFTTKSSGTGLGLAISKSILEKSGATISYSRSFVLGGACFSVVFPKSV